MSKPQKPTDMGPNRSGAGTSPIDSKRTAEGAQRMSPDSSDATLFADTRREFSREAPPIGRMPPPATLKGAATTAAKMVTGEKPTVFLDKLGERLAFERTGTRLYEALLVKFDAGNPKGMTRDVLEDIRTDEQRHAGMLLEAIEHLGADPTALTPAADITGVASLGLVQALGDPRTTFTQAMDVILIAELADTEGWRMLSELAESLGHSDLATRFHAAEEEEEYHVTLIRDWLKTSVMGQAKGRTVSPTQPSPSA